MPTNRKSHSAVVLGSSMFVYGGYIDMRGSSQEFWRLDFDFWEAPDTAPDTATVRWPTTRPCTCTGA
ncbi:hypothetical protein CRUP_018951 [Coryphaenoides rupestris]|nr:hypothetical protein CRUP_018951 [Coryphaenoides rupestris]